MPTDEKEGSLERKEGVLLGQKAPKRTPSFHQGALLNTNTVIEAVANRALAGPYKIWGFGEGMALAGLAVAGEALDRPEWIDFVVDLVRPALDRPADPTDHLIPVEVLHVLARLRPGLPTRKAQDRFVRAVWREGRPVPCHRPDLPELATTVWVDCLHTDGPGLVLAGLPDAGATVVEHGCAILQDGSGLFSHGYDVETGRANGVHWGRGQGWALHGLTGTGSATIQHRRERLLTGLARHEHDGSWRTIVDDPAAPIEHSVSALVAAGILHGRSPGQWDAIAGRALRAAIAALDTDGGLPVSAATPAADRTTYLDRPVGVHPWGQGPLLLALLLARESR